MGCLLSLAFPRRGVPSLGLQALRDTCPVSALCRVDLRPPRPPRGLTTAASPSPQLKARCEELKLDWSTLSLENLLKEKQALRSQISEKQRHCLELQVGAPLGFDASRTREVPPASPPKPPCSRGQDTGCVAAVTAALMPHLGPRGGWGGAGLGVRGAPLAPGAARVPLETWDSLGAPTHLGVGAEAAPGEGSARAPRHRACTAC